MTHTTIRDIAIAFGYEVNKQSESKVNESVDKLKSYASKVLGAIAVYFTVKGLSSLAEAAANAEALKSQFSQVFGDMEDQAAKTMKGIADETGVSVGRMRGSFAQIAAFAKTTGMDTENALGLTDRAMRAVADSAAFYDRSLEDVTASLQSFLKGNYANDAALGLSATETTRNTAANALYGKSFKDLAEDQKQLTLLKMVEDANAASGALGQAARESDTWGNQLGNLKQSLTDLKVEVGGAFLKPAIQVLKLFSQLVEHTTDAIKAMTAEGRLLNRMFERVTNWLKKAQVYIDRFVKKVGGAENAFKLLAIAAASIFTAINAGAILSFVKNLTSLLNPLNLKVLAIAGVIAMLFLAVDDFMHFMQGNNSVIGVIFEKWGIDADAVRQSIIATWDKVKGYLTTTWQAIKNIFKGVVDFIKGVFTGDWEAAFGGLKSIVGSTFAYIEDVFGKFAPVVKAIAAAFAAWKVVGVFVGLAKGVGTVIKITSRIKGLGVVFGLLTSPLGLVVAGIAALTAGIAWFVKSGGDVDGLVQKFTKGLDGIIGVVKNVTAGIAEKAPEIIAAITGAITKVVAVITEKLPEFIDMGVNLITSLIDGISSVVSRLTAAAGDFIPKIVTVITDNLPKVIAAGGNILSSLIKGLSDALPKIAGKALDLITSLVNSITDNLPKVIGAGKDILLSIISGIADTVPRLIADAAGMITKFVSELTGRLPELVDAGIRFIDSLVEGLVGAIPDLVAEAAALIVKIAGALKDNLPDILNAGKDLVIEIAKGLVEAIPHIIAAIPKIIDAILDGLSKVFPDLAPIFDGISAGFTTLFDGVEKIFENAKQIFNGIVDFISGVFTGDWEKAWQGVKDVFRGIVDSLVELVKTPINAIIDLINGAIEGLNKIKVPDWVPGMGGKGINIPLIPKLAKGSDFSPDTFIAGEKGPELITGAKGKKVFTAFETSGIFGAIDDALNRVVNAANAVGERLETGSPRRRNEEIKADISVDAPSDSGIVEAVKGIGGMIDNAVRFVADKIPQIKEKADSSGITDAIRSFGSDMSVLAQNATASPATVQSMVTSTMNRNVTQTNYFESTFNGERAAQKRMSESAGKNAEDAAGMLARALAYAR